MPKIFLCVDFLSNFYLRKRPRLVMSPNYFVSKLAPYEANA